MHAFDSKKQFVIAKEGKMKSFTDLYETAIRDIAKGTTPDEFAKSFFDYFKNSSFLGVMFNFGFCRLFVFFLLD